MNTNIKFNTIKTNKALIDKVLHIKREGGSYEFEPDIVMLVNKDVKLKEEKSKKQLSKDVCLYKSRLKKYEKELDKMLTDGKTTDKKLEAKFRTVERAKANLVEVQNRHDGRTGLKSLDYRELILSIPNANQNRFNKEFQDDIKNITHKFVASLKLGQTLCAAQHRDQHSIHSHYIIDSKGTFTQRMEDLDRYRGIQLKFNQYVRDNLDKKYGELDHIGTGRNYKDVEIYKKMATEYNKEINDSIKPKKEEVVENNNKDNYYKKSYVHKLREMIKENVVSNKVNDYYRKTIDNLTSKVKELTEDIEKYKRRYESRIEKYKKLENLYINLKDHMSNKNLEKLKNIIKDKDKEIKNIKDENRQNNLEINQLKLSLNISKKEINK